MYDVKEIHKLEILSFHSSESFTEDIITDLCSYGDGFVYVDDNKIVGTSLLIIDEKIICSICVHPDYQRKGIASMLIKHSIKHMKSPVYLYVRTTNTPAINLYKKLGFKTVDTIVDFYTKQSPDLPGDAYHMCYLEK